MKINHAIIGCGHIAPSHVYGCQKNDVNIFSCFDIDIDKAKKFAESHNISLVANSYEEILNNKTIDSVSICTPHNTHAQLAIKALNAGKNVVVEKPMALNVSDGKSMIETAQKNNKVLSVISQHRYNGVIMEIKKSLDNGVFGSITMVNATLNCQKNTEYYTDSDWRGTLEQEGGSSLINQAIHSLDLVLWVKGAPEEVKSYYSTLKFKDVIETEDTLVSIMKFFDNSLGVFSTTNTSVDIWDSKIEFVGTKGTISFSADYPVKILHLIHEDPAVATKLLALYESFADKFSEAPPVSYYGTKHREQMGDIFSVILGETKELFIKPEEALRTLSVVEKIYNYEKK